MSHSLRCKNTSTRNHHNAGASKCSKDGWSRGRLAAGCTDSAVLPSPGAPVAVVPNGSSRGEGVVRGQVVRVVACPSVTSGGGVFNQPRTDSPAGLTFCDPAESPLRRQGIFLARVTGRRCGLRHPARRRKLPCFMGKSKGHPNVSWVTCDHAEKPPCV
jgi:hypothetical protein